MFTFTKSFEESAAANGVICTCHRPREIWYMRGIGPEAHAEGCPMRQAYLQWRQDGRAKYEQVRAIVVDSELADDV